MINAYLGHSNTVNLALKSNSTAVDLSAVNKITLSFKDVLLESTNSTESITWNQSGYATGEIRIHFGNQSTLVAGIYEAPLIVYSPTDTAGVFWGDVPLNLIADMEASS